MNLAITKHDTIAAVVVTYNRKALLSHCLASLLAQTRPVDVVYVVDNASTDGTDQLIANRYRDRIVYERLAENLGGAGGFHHGIKRALQAGVDWVWLMDDDCSPDPDCLEWQLHLSAFNELTAPLKVDEITKRPVSSGGWIDLGNPKQPAGGLAFNCLLMHRTLISAVGLPIKEFFLDRDDTEFSIRVAKKGFGTFVITKARMYHPADTELLINALGYRRLLSNYAATPTRACLKARNSIWTYRLHKDTLNLGWVIRQVGWEIVAAAYQLRANRLLSIFRGALVGILRPHPVIEYLGSDAVPCFPSSGARQNK